MIAKDKEVDDRWRGFERPVSSRNLANDVDDKTVVELSNAVATMVPAPLSDLEHAVAIVGFDDANAVPGSAQRIRENSVVLVFENDGVLRGNSI